MLDPQLDQNRRRSTFYVSLNDSPEETRNSSEENNRSLTKTGSGSSKKGLLVGLFRSPSGLDLGKHRSSNSHHKNSVSSLESLNRKLEPHFDDDLNKTSCSLSSVGSESDFSYVESYKDDTRNLSRRIRRREYSKKNGHLLRNSLENCSTPQKAQANKADLCFNSPEYKSKNTPQKLLKPIALFDINKSSFDVDKNVLSPTTDDITKRNSLLYLEDNTSQKVSPKCVTLPNNLSAKSCLDYGEKKAAKTPREIALSPSEPPGRRLVGFSFIRRTHSTKISRSPSLLKTLTSKCVDDGLNVIKKDDLKDDNKKKLVEDEDQGVLSGMFKLYSFFYLMLFGSMPYCRYLPPGLQFAIFL